MTTTQKNGNGSRTRASTKKEMEVLRTSIMASEPVDDKVKQARKSRQNKIEAIAADISVEKVATELAKTSVLVSQSLASISDELKEKVNQLGELNEAIQFRKEELENLHGKDIIASAIDTLIAEYDEKAKSFAIAQNERRAAWDKEQVERIARDAELVAKIKTERERESEIFNYALEKGKREALANLEQEIYNRKLEERERKHNVEREIKAVTEAAHAREVSLAEKESQLKIELEKFEKSKGQIIADVEKSKNAQHEIASRMMKQDYENKIKLADQEIAYLGNSLKSANAIIESLKGDLENMQNKMQSMAIASLEASSDRKVAQAVQDLAEKQGKGK